MPLEDIGLHDGPAENKGKQTVLDAYYMPENGSLQGLNIDRELYTTYAKAKNYLTEIQSAEDAAPNHVAQVFNTISTILKEIVKMQTELYSAERVKKLEAAMITALKLAPKDVQESFFTAYEKILAEQ